VGVEHLIVLDDNSVDGSTDNLPCTVHRLPELGGKGQFEGQRMQLVSGIARGLLACYDVVILADADEFIIADPARYPTLVDFVAGNPDRKVMAPVALNVVQHTGVEGPLDPARPVLGQRRFAKFVPLMCKPALKRVPAEWRHASHSIRHPFEICPDLFMIHLKFHDRAELRSRADHRRQVVNLDGRAGNSNWRWGGDVVRRLDRMVADADPDTTAEFDPRSVDLGIVRRIRERYQAVGAGQVRAMERQPLVRVPERLFGLV
jgi:hypothetical protein